MYIIISILFNKKAFREAYINAVLHNDWSTRSGPSVFLFKDHLEVYSHGTPLNILTKDEFLRGKSKPINPELAKVFMKFDNFEESGRGVSSILEFYNKSVFDFSCENSFTVSFPFNELALDTDVTTDVTTNVTTSSMNEYEEVFIRLIQKNPSCTRGEMANAIGKTIRTVQRIINASKKIRRVGTNMNGHWEIIDKEEEQL